MQRQLRTNPVLSIYSSTHPENLRTALIPTYDLAINTDSTMYHLRVRVRIRVRVRARVRVMTTMASCQTRDWLGEACSGKMSGTAQYGDHAPV